MKIVTLAYLSGKMIRLWYTHTESNSDCDENIYTSFIHRK